MNKALSWNLGSREENGQTLSRSVKDTSPVVTDVMEGSTRCSGTISLRTSPILRLGVSRKASLGRWHKDSRGCKGMPRSIGEKHFRLGEHVGSFEAGMGLVQSSHTEMARGASQASWVRAVQDYDQKMAGRRHWPIEIYCKPAYVI